MAAMYGDMYPDLNNAPQQAMQKVYWDRKLPPGFRYVLEKLARYLLREQPRNLNEGAYRYLEELLETHKKEIAALPDYSYLQWLNDKAKGVQPKKPKRPPCVKCCKCGKVVNAAALAGANASGGKSQGPVRQLICDGDCKIMALPWTKDRHGHVQFRRGTDEDDAGPPLSCRSLALMLDY